MQRGQVQETGTIVTLRAAIDRGCRICNDGCRHCSSNLGKLNSLFAGLQKVCFWTLKAVNILWWWLTRVRKLHVLQRYTAALPTMFDAHGADFMALATQHCSTLAQSIAQFKSAAKCAYRIVHPQHSQISCASICAELVPMSILRFWRRAVTCLLRCCTHLHTSKSISSAISAHFALSTTHCTGGCVSWHHSS